LSLQPGALGILGKCAAQELVIGFAGGLFERSCRVEYLAAGRHWLGLKWCGLGPQAPSSNLAAGCWRFR